MPPVEHPGELVGLGERLKQAVFLHQFQFRLRAQGNDQPEPAQDRVEAVDHAIELGATQPGKFVEMVAMAGGQLEQRLPQMLERPEHHPQAEGQQDDQRYVDHGDLGDPLDHGRALGLLHGVAREADHGRADGLAAPLGVDVIRRIERDFRQHVMPAGRAEWPGRGGGGRCAAPPRTPPPGPGRRHRPR